MKATTRILVTAAVLSATPKAWAESTTGAAFLQVTPSVRAFGLGMANAMTAIGAEAVGANPANLGLMPRRFDVYSSYASLISGSQYEHLSAAYAPASLPLDACGIAVTHLQTSGFQGADSQGNLTGASYGTGDTAVSLTGSAAVTSRLRLGVTSKMIQSQLAGYSSNLAFGGDLGLTYTFGPRSKPVSVGASVTNVGQGLRYLSQTDRLPTAASLGLALPVGPAMFVAEVNRLLYQQRTEAGIGVELGLGPVAFRGGYLAQNQTGNLSLRDQSAAGRLFASGLTAGVGVQVGATRLDYSLAAQAVEFGMTQRVGLSLQFGGASGKGEDTQSERWHTSEDRSDWMIRSLGSY